MLILPLQLPPQVVKPIFNPVIRPAGYHLRHFGPLTSAGVVEVEDLGVFGWGPIGRFKAGVEMVHIPLAALFPGAFWHGLCHERPFHRHAHRLHHIEEACVFFLRPCLWTGFAFGSIVAVVDGDVVVELGGDG